MILLNAALTAAAVSVIGGAVCGAGLYLWLRGSIFTDPVSRAEAWRDAGEGVRGFFGSLLTCPLCLGTHLSWPFCLFTLLVFGPYLEWLTGWIWFWVWVSGSAGTLCVSQIVFKHLDEDL